MQVWDGIVRLLHWTLASLVIFELVYDDGGYTHRMVGYVAAVVVLLRLSLSLNAFTNVAKLEACIRLPLLPLGWF